MKDATLEGFILIPDKIAERTDLTPTQKLVLCVVGRIQGASASCYPSVRYIAAAVGMSERAIQYAISDLVTKKEVTRLYHKNQTSTYSAKWATARNIRRKWAMARTVKTA